MGRKCTAGGSLALASLIDKAGEALYQDFRSEYGLNFKDVVAEESPFEVLMLIRGLKLGSRFLAAVQGGDDFVGWDVQTYQMASIIDAINNTSYAIVASNSKRKPKAPKPSYRPKKERKSTNAFRQQLDIAKQRRAKGG